MSTEWVTISNDEFESRFQPGENTDLLSPAELAQVDPLCLWTVTDMDGILEVISGDRWVNRIGHIVCAVPRQPGEAFVVEEED